MSPCSPENTHQLPPWLLEVDPPRLGEENMARDRALLEACARGEGPPAVRFYRWSPPCLSLGRFQSLDPVLDTWCRRHGVSWVRRPTGGGAVLHHRDLTYCVVAREEDPRFPRKGMDRFQVVAQALLEGLSRLGVPARVFSREHPHRTAGPPPGFHCFGTPYGYEIGVSGRKLVGSAQRRVRGAFLQHGSLLLEPDPLQEDLYRLVAPEAPGVPWITLKEILGEVPPLEVVIQALIQGFETTLGIRWAGHD